MGCNHGLYIFTGFIVNRRGANVGECDNHPVLKKGSLVPGRARPEIPFSNGTTPDTVHGSQCDVYISENVFLSKFITGIIDQS